MYLTVKQQLKHLSKDEFLSLRELSHAAKNLYNQAVYNIRQFYFQEKKYLYASRNNKVNDYMSKTARKIIDYCLENNIGTLVCGYNETFQRNSNIGKANNQTFVNIP